MKLMKLTLSVLTAILICSSVFATNEGKIEQANKKYNDLQFTEAAKLLESALLVSDNPMAKMKLADCYRLTNNYKKAEQWYKEVINLGESKPMHKLYYAQALMSNGKYAEATAWLEQYTAEMPSDKRGGSLLEGLKNMTAMDNQAAGYKLEHMPFNSAVSDFGAAFYKDGLIFASERDSASPIRYTHGWTGNAFLNMYSVEPQSDDNQNWSNPTKMLGKINKQFHEGPGEFANEFNDLYFTRSNYRKGFTGAFSSPTSVGRSSENIVKLKIFKASMGDFGAWNIVSEFPYNNDEYSVGHPTVDASGTKMYFSSDMPGGYGEVDLYVSEYNGSSWGQPMNLGPEINTEGDEMFPFIHDDGTLYFASDGHPGYGGLDVYAAQGEGTGWTSVENLGRPLNSSRDDFNLIFNDDNSKGFVSSNREGGAGSDDIYSVIPSFIVMEGIVVDAVTDEPITNADVNLSDGITTIGKSMSSEKGMFRFKIGPDKSYATKASAAGYNVGNVEFSTTELTENVFVKIPLKKAVVQSLLAKGIVVDKSTGSPINNANVVVVSKCSGAETQLLTGSDGRFEMALDPDCEYEVVASKADYLRDVYTFNTYGKTKGDVFATLRLQNFAIGQSIEIRDIYYDFNKASIRSDAVSRLNELLNLIRENPEYIVEIGSHTDSRGSDTYNQDLSQRRAQSVVAWLISNGISSSSLQARGYGETSLRNRCANGIKCDEQEHQENRRTEFTVKGLNKTFKSKEDVLYNPGGYKGR